MSNVSIWVKSHFLAQFIAHTPTGINAVKNGSETYQYLVKYSTTYQLALSYKIGRNAEA